MRIALLGDIAFLGSYSKTNNDKLKQNLKEVSDYLSHFDYVVGNLETPFSSARKPYGAKSAFICANPIDISILKFLNLNAVTLANNHMFDFGAEGYELTKKLLENAGIEWFGAEGKELIVEKCNSKLAFAGFCCYTSNPLNCVSYGEYGVNAYNLSKAKDFIKQSHINGYLPIIAVHAGLEHVNYPSLDHIRAARQLSDVGRYVYYGHHPHVIQGVEEYNDSLIAHSLGNFCFDDVYSDSTSDKPLVVLTDNNRQGMILELDVEQNIIIGWHEQVIDIKKNGIIMIPSNNSIAEYNLSLKECEIHRDDYIKKRNQMLLEWMAERKSIRTLKWYLKRLRLRYIILIFNARKNKKLYNENVRYLNNIDY